MCAVILRESGATTCTPVGLVLSSVPDLTQFFRLVCYFLKVTLFFKDKKSK
jgi:hypothetical protein